MRTTVRLDQAKYYNTVYVTHVNDTLISTASLELDRRSFTQLKNGRRFG
jgi:hypothetical protein